MSSAWVGLFFITVFFSLISVVLSLKITIFQSFVIVSKKKIKESATFEKKMKKIQGHTKKPTTQRFPTK